MKAAIILSVAGLLATGGVSLQAGEPEQEQLAQCQRELEHHYGEVADVRVVNRQRFGDGVRLKLAVQLEGPVGGNYSAKFATCWVDGAAAVPGDGDGAPAVAASSGDGGLR